VVRRWGLPAAAIEGSAGTSLAQHCGGVHRGNASDGGGDGRIHLKADDYKHDGLGRVEGGHAWLAAASTMKPEPRPADLRKPAVIIIQIISNFDSWLFGIRALMMMIAV